MYIGVGGSSPKHDVRTAVVYDPSGRVIHTHHVVTFAGGTAMDDDQIRARALKFAEDLAAGSSTTVPGKLETILVDGRALLPGTTYSVDTKRRELVPGKSYAIHGKPTG
ncbi:MAG: hypothetical protein WBS19_11145 [Candidatus Korobacteraceae bacterium]